MLGAQKQGVWAPVPWPPGALDDVAAIMATSSSLSAWSLGSREGQLWSLHSHPYLEVPIAIVEINGESLEACPELLVILGTRGAERRGEVARLSTSHVLSPASGPLH